MRPGPLALVGSGEYTLAMQDVEAALLEDRPPVFVQLATAAAPEGDASLRYWHELGRQAADRLRVRQVVVPVVDRADADDPGLAELVSGAGLVYLSGGNPAYLAATLFGTRTWEAIEAAWQDGAALAGCSAGAMALGPEVRHLWDLERAALPGLGAVPHLTVIPHFDRFAARFSGDDLRRLSVAVDGATVIGIDEDTALIGGLEDWEVQGRGSVWVFAEAHPTEMVAGERLRLPIR